jgi:membrane-associated protein
MSYARFGSYNIIGAVLWVAGFLLLGYFFGGIPFVENNFPVVILTIIILSLLPPIIEVIRGGKTKA